MLVRSLCGSGARFQVSEASSPFYCFVMKFLLRDVDSEPMWLRVHIPGFWSLITILLYCQSFLIQKCWFGVSVAQGPDSRFLKPYHNPFVLLSSSYQKMLMASLCGSGARFQVLEPHPKYRFWAFVAQGPVSRFVRPRRNPINWLLNYYAKIMILSFCVAL